MERSPTLSGVSTEPAQPRLPKLRQEDFCSLSGRMPTQKYEASAEECAALVRMYTADADDSLRRCFCSSSFRSGSATMISI